MEDYKKKYDDLIERLRKAKNDNDYCDERYCCVIDELAPDVKESEDERIRKWLIRTLKSLNNSPVQIDGAYEMMLPAIAWLEKQGEQNPAWSEEDERMFNSALWHVKNSCGNGGKNSGEFEVYNWLKDLKDRVQPQPKQEWSEEDEAYYDTIVRKLKAVGDDSSLTPNQIDFLDKHRLKSYWKPSDEQIKLLREVQQALLGKDCHNRFVNFMYELKRLREE